MARIVNEVVGMSVDLVTRAQAGDDDAFARLVEPYRRELHVHCYRILGSFTEADDALQETLLAAWQGLSGYEGRASLRTWLYTVATSRCLLLLRTARRRPQVDWPPPGLALPEPSGRNEITWLEPYPDDLLASMADTAVGPEARYEASETITLAFITTLQLLPPRQRAVLILRDVLGFRASEVAAALETTEESVTSALKRARATLDRHARSTWDQAPEPGSAQERDLVSELARAYETGDIARLVALLTEDVVMSMPPIPLVYAGRRLVVEFLAALVFLPGHTYQLVPTRANGQPAFGMYLRETPDAVPRPLGVMVFTLSGARIRGLTRFDTSVLPAFGLGPAPS
jgi:RNA polymerase sigma-70 factor (ECF subfamily)